MTVDDVCCAATTGAVFLMTVDVAAGFVGVFAGTVELAAEAAEAVCEVVLAGCTGGCDPTASICGCAM